MNPTSIGDSAVVSTDCNLYVLVGIGQVVLRFRKNAKIIPYVASKHGIFLRT